MSENIKEEIENKIIDLIANGAGGRLVVFKPESFDDGADLVVIKKGEYKVEENKNLLKSIIVKTKIFGNSSKKKSKKIFLSVNGLLKESNGSIFIKNVNIEELKKNDNFYLVFVFLNILKQDLDDHMCFISLQEFIKISGKENNENIFKFESLLSLDKKDKYSKFLINKKDFAQILFDTISKV